MKRLVLAFSLPVLMICSVPSAQAASSFNILTDDQVREAITDIAQIPTQTEGSIFEFLNDELCDDSIERFIQEVAGLDDTEIAQFKSLCTPADFKKLVYIAVHTINAGLEVVKGVDVTKLNRDALIEVLASMYGEMIKAYFKAFLTTSFEQPEKIEALIHLLTVYAASVMAGNAASNFEYVCNGIFNKNDTIQQRHALAKLMIKALKFLADRTQETKETLQGVNLDMQWLADDEGQFIGTAGTMITTEIRFF
jgi:hypothetical protein